MSHELRTPLNAILGFSSLLRGAGCFRDAARRPGHHQSQRRTPAQSDQRRAGRGQDRGRKQRGGACTLRSEQPGDGRDRYDAQARGNQDISRCWWFSPPVSPLRPRRCRQTPPGADQPCGQRHQVHGRGIRHPSPGGWEPPIAPEGCRSRSAWRIPGSASAGRIRRGSSRPSCRLARRWHTRVPGWASPSRGNSWS